MADHPGAHAARGHVLVAEDEPHIRRILVTMLESADFSVHATCDGSEAIDVLRTDEPVDLLVTDLMMPEASGLEVLEALGDMPGRRGLPVVMLTAKGQDADRDAALSLGAADFMTKPFSPKKLLARIQEILAD